MKLHKIVFVLLLCVSLLSGCGKSDDSTDPAPAPPPVVPSPAPDLDWEKELTEYLVGQCGIEKLGTAATEVELMTRENEAQKWLFVINHTNEEQVYSLNDKYTMLEGEKEGFLKPYEVQLFTKNKFGK